MFMFKHVAVVMCTALQHISVLRNTKRKTSHLYFRQQTLRDQSPLKIRARVWLAFPFVHTSAQDAKPTRVPDTRSQVIHDLVLHCM